ncbi:nucleotide exchange factor GrpE [Patescibacteria group bacterium]|nr:nucleotide exchange factor GrpE [Patescibacteria group bacterium]MBU4458493.1 nucleotide exchange factor GrpE [Patescibacteria group bacterium]MCG2696361.1 nucleotide exchange factor GrpE [Candidatus Portnoybacteria bacterium]
MNNKEKIRYEVDLSAEAPEGAKAEHKIKGLKEQLKKAEQERAEYLAGWQRAKADLINYKKEQEAKISEIFKFANEGLIYDVLPVLDSFELAMKHFENNHKNTEGLGQEEIKQIYNQFKNILKSSGVEEIQVAGEKFNPEFHEAVGEIEGKEQGIIVEEVQKGYKLNNKVIRASKVKISK